MDDNFKIIFEISHLLKQLLNMLEYLNNSYCADEQYNNNFDTNINDIIDILERVCNKGSITSILITDSEIIFEILGNIIKNPRKRYKLALKVLKIVNILIDFDDNTKLSSDGNIHYFKIDTTGLPVERFYRILINKF